MENDKTILNSQEKLVYECPQFTEFDAPIMFGTNPESGGRDDGTGSGGKSEDEETYDDGY